MGLFDKIRGEFIDIIEWLGEDRDVMVYRFERYQNEIKNGAKLTVRQGQAAVFVNEGKVADVFEPGMYTLNTQNLPILSTLKGWKYGFDSPFKAEVYFVNTRRFTGMKWGTPAPITLNDDRYGFVEIRAFGTYELKVTDPGKFLEEVVGTDGEFTTQEITEQVRSIVVREFTDGVGEANLPIEAYAGNIKELSEAATAALNQDMTRYGLDIPQFYIENVNMPDEVKKEIYEYSRLNKIDLNKLAQMKAAKAMEAAAANPGGDAGAGMGMGMGFAMAQQFGNMFAQSGGGASTQPAAAATPPSAGGPPPLPQSMALFVAINGAQQGPLDQAAVQGMINKGEITRDTLVWKEGMSNWTAASLVPEVNKLFGAVPPPLPG